KAAMPEWNYHSSEALVEGPNFIQILKDEWIPNATLSQIAPDGGSVKTDSRTHFLTLLLGKDPNMATALNSYAVTDDDILAHLGTGETCGPGWGNYICKPERQLMSNMIYSLWQFDSMYGS